jgi:hypothetical protein
VAGKASELGEVTNVPSRNPKADYLEGKSPTFSASKNIYKEHSIKFNVMQIVAKNNNNNNNKNNNNNSIPLRTVTGTALLLFL